MGRDARRSRREDALGLTVAALAETLDTLNEALSLQIMITVLVIVLMLRSLGGSLLVAGLLPVALLFCFVAMKAAALLLALSYSAKIVAGEAQPTV